MNGYVKYDKKYIVELGEYGITVYPPADPKHLKEEEKRIRQSLSRAELQAARAHITNVRRLIHAWQNMPVSALTHDKRHDGLTIADVRHEEAYNLRVYVSKLSDLCDACSFRGLREYNEQGAQGWFALY